MKTAHDLFENARVLILPYKHIDDSGVISAGINYLLPSLISDLNGFAARGLNSKNSFIIEDFCEKSWLNVMDRVLNEKLYNEKLESLKCLRRKSDSWDEIALKTKYLYDH